MKFEYDKSVSLKAFEKTLFAERERLQASLDKVYMNEYASINLPDQDVTALKNMVSDKKKLKPALLIVIGIGGSNLGTLALQEAQYGQRDKRVIFADTVDSDKTQRILTEAEALLKEGKTVMLNVVTKSGGTTETIALAEVFINLLKQYQKEYFKYVVVTTNQGSKLEILAHDEKFSILPIPVNVGGRYSVFSNVGLFPLVMLDFNIDKLLEGAKEARNDALKPFNQNVAMKNAALIYSYNKRGRNIYDTFLFDTALEGMGKWYRQLMGESVGKEKNKAGKIVNAGVTPTVSVGSTDLHSMAQLYLGGPNDKYTSFVTVEHTSEVLVPDWQGFDNLVPNLQNKTLPQLMRAIISGVQAAYTTKKRPYSTFMLERKSEYELAYYMQTRMIEMMYVAALLGVNAFDQPAVETYKTVTKEILAR